MIKLRKNIGINKYAIKLVESKQLLYTSIYTFSLVELKILKAYITTYLKPGFILPFKSLAKELIFFDKKADRSLHFYVDYWSINNLTINNRYSLLLISKILNGLGQAK